MYLVSQADGEIVGLVQPVAGTHAPERLDAGVAFLTSLYVHPAHWREGVGEQLLSEGRARLPASVDRIELAVFADNEIGQQFYETHGFERTGEGRFEIGNRLYDTKRYATPR